MKYYKGDIEEEIVLKSKSNVCGYSNSGVIIVGKKLQLAASSFLAREHACVPGELFHKG